MKRFVRLEERAEEFKRQEGFFGIFAAKLLGKQKRTAPWKRPVLRGLKGGEPVGARV